MTLTLDQLDQLTRVRRLTSSGAARSIRQAAGLSQSELAGSIAVCPSTLHRWEVGERRPTGALALRYLDALDRLRKSQP